jgi:hypothetical protein
MEADRKEYVQNKFHVTSVNYAILFIYGLFNDAFSSSDCIVSNDRMIANNELASICKIIFGDIPAFAWKHYGKSRKTWSG